MALATRCLRWCHCPSLVCSSYFKVIRFRGSQKIKSSYATPKFNIILMHLLAGGLSQPRYPLLNQCHDMSLLAQDLTAGFSEYYSGTSLNCSLIRQRLLNSPLDCTRILCQDDRGSTNFTLQLVPCSDPPAVRVTQIETSRGIYVNTSLTMSEIFALDLGGESTSAFLFFGIGQHTNWLSLGFEVSSLRSKSDWDI